MKTFPETLRSFENLITLQMQHVSNSKRWNDVYIVKNMKSPCIGKLWYTFLQYYFLIRTTMALIFDIYPVI